MYRNIVIKIFFFTVYIEQMYKNLTSNDTHMSMIICKD